jgi:hypothetical protein
MDKKLVLPSLIFYILGLLALHFPIAVNAADRPLEKIRIAYTGISGAQIPAWVAYEHRFLSQIWARCSAHIR